jgi:hypothetical protein
MLLYHIRILSPINPLGLIIDKRLLHQVRRYMAEEKSQAQRNPSISFRRSSSVGAVLIPSG